MTGTGKTSLAKQLSNQALNSGKKSYYLTPDANMDLDFPCTYRTIDKEAFLKFMFESRGHIFFIDESRETVGPHAKEMTKTATRTRHLNHTVCFIGQRSQMIDTNVREQCEVICAFNQSKKNGVILADTYGDDLFKEVNSLPVGTFIYRLSAGIPAQKVILFSKT